MSGNSEVGSDDSKSKERRVKPEADDLGKCLRLTRLEVTD
jgi:hypothetical protein